MCIAPGETRRHRTTRFPTTEWLKNPNGIPPLKPSVAPQALPWDLAKKPSNRNAVAERLNPKPFGVRREVFEAPLFDVLETRSSFTTVISEKAVIEFSSGLN
jgi:hypothetical protein